MFLFVPEENIIKLPTWGSEMY